VEDVERFSTQLQHEKLLADEMRSYYRSSTLKKEKRKKKE
jgi:hypothetical protein